MREPRVAALFPGQGSQCEGMGERVARLRPDLYEHACSITGTDPFEHADECSAYLQPAVYCTSLALWSVIEEDAGVLAGHSLGEFAALAAAGVLDEHEGLELVSLRGQLADEMRADDAGGMVAVLGRDAVDYALTIAEQVGLVVANDNSPRQVVLSGPLAGIEAVLALQAPAGLELSRLNVAAAFHSPQMAPIVPRFRAALERTNFAEPRRQVVSGATAEPFVNPVDDLAFALTAPVRWQATVSALSQLGVERYVEVGPGRVLSGLVRRIIPGADVSAPSMRHALA